MASLLLHTVMPSGGDFTSLNAALDHLEASHANLVTADVYAEIKIDGTWSSSDTTAATVHNLTTDATRYLHIYTTTAARHAGKWNTGAYNLAVTNSAALTISEDYVRVDGLQISVASIDGTGDHPVIVTGISATNNDIQLSNLIVVGANSSTTIQDGINILDTDTKVSIWNCIIYGLGAVNLIYNAGIRLQGATNNVYSCTIIGGYRGISCSAGTSTLKNCYAGGSYAEDISYVGGTVAKTNCASEDASADDTGASETQTNCVTSKALDTDTFINVTGGSEDFHLAADGLSPLQGAGVDTSGDAAPLNFTTDIDGQSRDATWEIGADAWYVVTGMINDVVVIFEC